ncbi:hypothetical protein ACOY9F_27650 [Citrobacter portucalensis]
MQKLKLIILPVLAFVWPSINATASTKTPMPTSQQSVAKSEANYEFISISAKYVDGMWLVNGQQRPVIKTGKRIKWLILPLHESETDRHLIGLSG